MSKSTSSLACAASLAAAALVTAGGTTAGATSTTTATATTVQAVRATQTLRRAGPARHVAYRQWDTPRQLRRGVRAGVVVRRGALRIGRPLGRVRYRDPETGRVTRYQQARWRSPWVRPGFRLSEAIASWDATTPRGTFVRVQMRVRTTNGRRSSWDSLGDWASHERRFHRTTRGAQRDDLAEVAADTLRARGRARLVRWQLKVTLFRRPGSPSPLVHAIGAMASRVPGGDARTRPTTMRRQRVLRVPRRSQMTHRGHYPRWGGGGEAWCSPTSTTMVLRFWGRGPRPRAYRWVPDRHRNPEVDYAARSVYDYGYDGAGNWAFNTAYANRFGLDSFVTRLRSLREAERFIRRGIPLVASIEFGPGELDGAPIGSTAGHLLVIRGFTRNGRVVVNDPAAPDNRTVRRVYRRGQFADAWLEGSGGLVYVIRPEGKHLPRRTREANW